MVNNENNPLIDNSFNKPQFQVEESEAKENIMTGTKKGKAKYRANLGHEALHVSAIKIKNIQNVTFALMTVISLIGLFQQIYLHLKYVPLKDGENTIYLNVNSLSERLGISKKAIYEAASKGELKQLIEEHRDHQLKLLKKYEAFQAMSEDDLAAKTGKQLPSKEEDALSPGQLKTTSTLSPVLLNTIIEESMRCLFQQGQDQITCKQRTSDLIIMVRKVSADDFEVVVEIYSKILGSGGFGEVREAFIINPEEKTVTPQTLAFKEAKTSNISKKERAEEDVKNEYEMLKHLHDLNKSPDPLRGIQAKPHQFVQIPSTTKIPSTTVGYLGARYDGDLNSTEAKNTSIQLKLKQCADLLAGLKFLHKNKVKHGDIKPGNILVKNENGELKAHIADYGGARVLDDTKKALWGTHTPLFTSKRHLEAVRRAENDKDFVKANEIARKNDLFSLGLTFYLHLAKPPVTKATIPFKLGKQNYGELSTKAEQEYAEKMIRKKLEDNQVLTEIIDLIVQMILAPPDADISAEELSSKFDAYLQSQTVV